MSRFGSDSKAATGSGSGSGSGAAQTSAHTELTGDEAVEPETPALERRESLSVTPYGAPGRVFTIFDRDEMESNKAGREEPPATDCDSKKATDDNASAAAAAGSTDLSALLADLSRSSGVAPPPLSRSSSQEEEDELDSADPFELALSGLTSPDIQSAFNSPYLLYLLRTDSLLTARKLLESPNEKIDVSLTDDKGFTAFIHLAGACETADEGR
jgi:hypothetical protein